MYLSEYVYDSQKSTRERERERELGRGWGREISEEDKRLEVNNNVLIQCENLQWGDSTWRPSRSFDRLFVIVLPL